jgi:hypothetical protein
MPEPQIVLRTSRTMYALFGGILGLVFLFAIYVSVTKEPAFWLATALSGIVLASFLTWMATTTLALTSDCVHYRSLFVKRDVPLAEVVSAKFRAGFSGSKPFQRLVLTVREQRDRRDVTINAGLFDPADIRRFMDALNARLR